MCGPKKKFDIRRAVTVYTFRSVLKAYKNIDITLEAAAIFFLKPGISFDGLTGVVRSANQE